MSAWPGLQVLHLPCQYATQLLLGEARLGAELLKFEFGFDFWTHRATDLGLCKVPALPSPCNCLSSLLSSFSCFLLLTCLCPLEPGSFLGLVILGCIHLARPSMTPCSPTMPATTH